MKQTCALFIALLIGASVCRGAAPATNPASIGIEAFLQEQNAVHEKKLYSLADKDPQFARDWRDATLIFNTINQLAGENKLQEALGDERPYLAAVGPMMSRDARAAEIHFVLDTMARLGDDDVSYDTFLLSLGVMCMSRGGPGDFDRADRYLTIAARGLEKSSRGRPNLIWARAVLNLGMAQMHEGNLPTSITTFRRALPIILAAGGRNDDWAQCENGLGESLREQGLSPVEAKQHLANALQWLNDVRKTADSPELQNAASAVTHNLALLAVDEGDIPQSRALELKALDLTGQVCRAVKNTPREKDALAFRARVLRQIAVLPLLGPAKPASVEGFAEALQSEKYLHEAIELYEQTLGHKHPESLIARLSLGMVYASEGKYDQAATMIESPSDYPQDIEPQFRIELMRLWSTLAIMGGRYDIAAEVTGQWDVFATQLLGSTSLFAVGARFNLAIIAAETHQFAKAEQTYRDVLQGARRGLDQAIAAHQERRQLVTEATFRKILDGYLSFKKMEGWKGDGGYGEVLSWKGAVFTHQIAIGRARTAGPADFAQFNQASQQISTLTLDQARDRPTKANDADWKKRQQDRWNKIESLNEEIDQSLSRISALTSSSPALDPPAIQELLPGQAALVDFIQYDNRNERNARGAITTTTRYVAWVVRRGKITPIDLGEAEPIDKAVTAWTTDRCRDSKAGLDVRKLVWDKLAPALNDTKLILISPDASLGNVPFGALPDADGTYLIERYAFASVAVPQLLPGLLQSPETTSGQALLLSAEIPKPGQAIETRTASLWSRLPRLEYAAVEIDQVAQLCAAAGISSVKLVGPDATKTQLRNALSSAVWLHYAGHAFFEPALRQAIESNYQSAISSSIGQSAAIDASLMCGLVLAPDPTNNDDGALTAYEIARMDLRKLNLVVLSGCDTAQGESVGGEGLLSLQRACQVAGARSVIASLWPVQDVATQRLMKYFYTELLATPRTRTLPLIALRKAQLRVLREAPAERHTVSIIGPPLVANEAINRTLPAAWAPWVLSGSPGDLKEIVNELTRESP